MSRNRRLLLHAIQALALVAVAVNFLLLDSGSGVSLLMIAAASASILVATGFAVRFVRILSPQPDHISSAGMRPSSPTNLPYRHWTEWSLVGWTGLCIAALTAEAFGAGLRDPRHVISVLVVAPIVGIIAMQSLRLVKTELDQRT